jgi:hypothetical protein
MSVIERNMERDEPDYYQYHGEWKNLKKTKKNEVNNAKNFVDFVDKSRLPVNNPAACMSNEQILNDEMNALKKFFGYNLKGKEPIQVGKMFQQRYESCRNQLTNNK